MKNILMSILMLLATVEAFAQDNLIADNRTDLAEPEALGFGVEIVLPVLCIAFLVFMLSTLIKYFLDFRLKNKLIEKGMTDQLLAYLSEKKDQNKPDEIIKMAILFCGVGLGLILIYFTSPIDIHSLAIMAFSLGLSYLAYFFYLRK